MELESYIDEDEAIIRRTPTKDTEISAAGTLAVTDRRLVHLRATESLLDTLSIDRSDIDAVEYDIEPIKLDVVGLGLAIAALGPLWYLYSPLAGDIPGIVFAGVTGFLLLAGLLVVFDGFNTRTETLTVTTDGEEYHFQGGSFSKFRDELQTD